MHRRKSCLGFEPQNSWTQVRNVAAFATSFSIPPQPSSTARQCRYSNTQHTYSFFNHSDLYHVDKCGVGRKKFSDAPTLRYDYGSSKGSWFRLSCRLRCKYAAVWLLGLRVWIPLRAWMFVSCVCCVWCRVAATATVWLIVQMSPAGCWTNCMWFRTLNNGAT
jgi:hypothetical protein